MSHDKTVNFLVGEGWEFNKSSGNFRHSMFEEWVPMDKAMEIQRSLDPESMKEYNILKNLNSKCLEIYEEYLDS